MKRLRKLFPLLAALVLVLPSCVLAIGNDGADWSGSEHPHQECEECAALGLHDDVHID